MAENSGLWSTEGVLPVGHQVVSYNQVVLGVYSEIMAACSGFEGLAPNYKSMLSASVPAANTLRVAAGGAIVDGKFYENSANEDIAIPDASAGNTRIDRIVLRADWVGYKVSLYRIAGVSGGSPVPPAITQTQGTTYDIMLYQVRVTDAGVVTIELDERVYAYSNPFDVAILTLLTPTQAVSVVDGIDTLPVPDIWNNKNVVRLWARLSGSPSSSGNVTVRVYNTTTAQTVGTITILESERIGVSTSITNSLVSEDDILRWDVTGAGTGALGLDVQIKVSKA